MELTLISLAIIGAGTIIVAISEWIGWLDSYVQEANEIAEEETFRVTYDKFSEDGYRE